MKNLSLDPLRESLITMSKSLFILFFVILIVYITIKLLKYLQNNFHNKKYKKAGLELTEILLLDNNRKIARISYKQKEFLLFLGTKGEFLLHAEDNNENLNKAPASIKSAGANEVNNIKSSI